MWGYKTKWEKCGAKVDDMAATINDASVVEWLTWSQGCIRDFSTENLFLILTCNEVELC